jgi:Fibrinogen beta and gamma chains, C-terminal globular domain
MRLKCAHVIIISNTVKERTHWHSRSTAFITLNFAGNVNLNTLTSAKRYKLRIDLADFNGTTTYAEYDNFVVNSAADKYILSSLGTYSGTAGCAVRMLHSMCICVMFTVDT